MFITNNNPVDIRDIERILDDTYLEEEKEEKKTLCSKKHKANFIRSEEKVQKHSEEKIILASKPNQSKLSAMPPKPSSELLSHQVTLSSSTLWRSFKSENNNSDKYKNNDITLTSRPINKSDLDSMPKNPCSPIMTHRRTLKNDSGWESKIRK